MTTHDRDKIIAAIKKATDTWTEDTTFIERFYAIAFKAGAASSDAEIAELKGMINELKVARRPIGSCMSSAELRDALDVADEALASTEPKE